MAPLTLTARAQKALSLSPGRGGEHLLLGLVLEGGGVPAKLLQTYGIRLDDLRASIGTAPEVWNVVGAAETIARRLRHDEVGTEHLMLALIEDPTSGPSRLLEMKGIKPADVRSDIFEILGVSA